MTGLHYTHLHTCYTRVYTCQRTGHNSVHLSACSNSLLHVLSFKDLARDKAVEYHLAFLAALAACCMFARSEDTTELLVHASRSVDGPNGALDGAGESTQGVLVILTMRYAMDPSVT